MEKFQITEMLGNLQDGAVDGLNQVMPVVYDELKRLANHHIHKERSNHTLNTTALVHEAYIQLLSQKNVVWKNRDHFFSVASLAMRRILVDYARNRKRLKRGGDVIAVTLPPEVPLENQINLDEILHIDRLLRQMEQFDPTASKVVECRFFGGLTIEETAYALGMGKTSVKQTWRLAKSWLKKESDLEALAH